MPATELLFALNFLPQAFNAQYHQKWLDKKINPHWLHPVDYAPFREMISKVLANTTDIPDIDQLNDTARCVLPKSSIMFTYGNDHLIPLLQLQYASMDLHKMRACLERRFVTVCLDQKTFHQCKSTGIPNCVLINVAVEASGFGYGSYFYAIWLKNELMYEATKVVNEIFFVDADCLLLRNPFIEVQYGRDNYRKISGPFDIMYQKERGNLDNKNCGGYVNSGQVYIRNSTQIQKYFDYMREGKLNALKGVNPENGELMLDQDVIANASYVAKLRRCSLSIQYYQGCPSWASLHLANPCEIITYHANCQPGGVSGKMGTLKTFYGHVKSVCIRENKLKEKLR